MVERVRLDIRASRGRILDDAMKNALCLFGLMGLAQIAAGQTPFVVESKDACIKERTPQVLFVPFVDSGVELDGELSEGLWRRAAVVNTWMDYPAGAPSPRKAELRIATDSKHVLVGFTRFMTDKPKEQFKKPRKGGDEYGASILEMFFDPSGVGKQKYQCCASPTGLRYDGRNDDKAWNGKWRSVGVVSDDRWTMEVAIPLADFGLKTLRAGSKWGGNFGFVLTGDIHTSWTGKWGGPGSDYGVLYFGSARDYAKTVKPRIALWLDREVYGLRDATAVALARVSSMALLPQGLELLVQVADTRGTSVLEERVGLISHDLDLTLDMQRLPAGSYSLTVSVLRDGVKITSAGKAFSKAKRTSIPEGPKAGRIAIRLKGDPAAAGASWPVSPGVAFAQGVLESPDHVRLLGPDGTEVPCQAAVRSTWSRRGSIRWLGLEFVPKLAPEQQEFILEYGPEVRRRTQSPLRCTENEDAVTIDTGPLRVRMGRKPFRLFEDVSLDLNGNGSFEPEERIIQPAADGGAYLVDHEGNVYEAAADRAAEVAIEESGPVRATIRCSGWYVKRGSPGKRTSCELPTDRLCKFTFRLSAFAGQTLLKLGATTVLTHDSTQLRLTDLALTLRPAAPQRVTIGTDKGQVQWDAERLRKEPYLVANRWDQTIGDDQQRGGRAEGWIDLAVPKGIIRVAVRNFWKLFPKEIEWKDGALRLHIWPAHGQQTFEADDELKWENIYKLWYCHQGKELDFRFPQPYRETLDAELERNPKAFGAYYKAMDYSNAQGLAVHNDLVIDFGPMGSDGPVLSHLADADPVPAADPAYTCATGVFGPLLHADHETFPAIEKSVDLGYRSLSQRTLSNNEYGMFVYGGGHTYWHYWKKPARAGIHRVWINGHYSIARVPILQFVRTGDPSYLHWGRDFSANLRDIGMVHYVSDERRFRYHNLGAMYHCKGFAPWAGDAHVAAHPTSVDWLIFYYYVTGDRRSRDVFDTWIAGLKEQSPGGYGTREGIQALAEMIVGYRYSWDAALIELMDRFARPIFRGKPIKEHHWFDYHPLLPIRYHGLTGSQQALDAYRVAMEAGGGGYGGGSFHLEALFSALDGKPELLKDFPALLHRQCISCVEQPGIAHNGLTTNMWLHYVYNFHKLPYLLKAMKDAGLKVQRPTRTVPAWLPKRGDESFVVIREAHDRAIPLRLSFNRAPGGPVRLTAHRADQPKVLEREITLEKGQTEAQVTLPADGKVGDYLIVINLPGRSKAAGLPLSDLQHEVALCHTGRSEVLPSRLGTRFYIRPGEDLPSEVVFSSDSKSASGMELVNGTDKALARASDSRYVGDPMVVGIPSSAATPLSIYISNHTYLDIRQPGRLLIFALRPESLFRPAITDKP